MRIGGFALFIDDGDWEPRTSSEPRTRHASLAAFVSTTQVNPLRCLPPEARPAGPWNSCWIMWPAWAEVIRLPHATARLARVWGEMDATKSLEFGFERLEIVGVDEEREDEVSRVSAGAESRTERTSLWLWRLTRTASAEVTQPEQARQSVRDICAGALAAPLEEEEEGCCCCPSRMTSNSRDSDCGGGAVAGRVSIGLMQATPGLMKSLRSSAERMADIFLGVVGAVVRREKNGRGGAMVGGRGYMYVLCL